VATAEAASPPLSPDLLARLQRLSPKYDANKGVIRLYIYQCVEEASYMFGADPTRHIKRQEITLKCTEPPHSPEVLAQLLVAACLRSDRFTALFFFLDEPYHGVAHHLRLMRHPEKGGDLGVRETALRLVTERLGPKRCQTLRASLHVDTMGGALDWLLDKMRDTAQATLAAARSLTLLIDHRQPPQQEELQAQPPMDLA